MHHKLAPIMLALIMSAIIPLMSVLVVSAVPDSADVPEIVEKIGTEGEGEGQFYSPMGVETDDSGALYALDSDLSTIQKFDRFGAYVGQWGASGVGNGQFSQPADVAVDPDGNIYVLDSGNRRVQKFDSNGTYLTKWGSSGSGNGQFIGPLGVASDSDGNIYVLDSGNRRVQKFDSNGTYLTKWGSSGSGNGQFQVAAQSIAIDSGDNIYVADTSNNRIQKFDSNGTYLTKWGTSGSGNGQFSSPRGVEVDQQDNVYVSDAGNGRIQKFDTNGTYLAQFGSEISGFGPSYIAVDQLGHIYASDANNFGIQKFSYPPESSALTSYSAGTDIELSANAFTTFSCSTSVTEDLLGAQDATKDYPLGLVDFCLDVPTGSTQTITITFETDLSASEVTARKYNPTTQTYTDIPDAEITETTLDGSPALQLAYDITDGGDLDDDGLANGTILDPVGLATVTPSTSLPDSGADTNADSATLADTGSELISLYVSIAVLFGLGVLIFAKYRRRVM